MASVIIRPYRVISGVGAGAGAALAMLIVMALLRFGFNSPTIPELMLNPIVRLLGGEAFSSALDNLYYAGRPLLFTVILEGTLVLGVLLGLVYAWLVRPDAATGKRSPFFDSPLGGILYGLLIGVLLNVVFLPLVDQPVFADRPYGLYADTPVPLWADLILLGLTFGVTLNWLLPQPPSPALVSAANASLAQATSPAPGMAPMASPVKVESPEAVDRRSFLHITGGALAAVLGGLVFTFAGTVLNQGGLTNPVTNTGGTGEGSDAGSVAEAGAPTTTAVSGDTPGPTLDEPELSPSATAIPPTDTPVPLQPTDTAIPEATSTAEAAQPEPPTTTPIPPTDTPLPTDTPVPTATAVPLPAIKVQEITPVDSFYHVSKNFFDPSPSANGWKLEIKGLVDNPYSLDYKALTSLPATVVTTGMMCISNPIGGGLIGNQAWKGVHLADLIKRAKPKVGVTKLLMRAVDDYSDSISLQKATDPDVMLVWEMGGKALTSQHGFPARLLVPGIYGMKHVKWITSIELVNYDFKGFWQDPSQGWSDPAPVNIMSRIDFPTEGSLSMKQQTFSGVAFAGDRSISKVELSTDGGKTWDTAYIKPPKSHTSWVVWGYNWNPPKPGKYTVMVRATDGIGNLQTTRRTDPYPNGATGYHSVTYVVKNSSG